MARVRLIYVEQSEEHLRLMANADLTPYDVASWPIKDDDAEGYIDLLKQVGVIADEDCYLESTVGRASAEDKPLPFLFYDLLLHAHESFPIDEPAPEFLLINLAPFAFPSSIVDHLITGLAYYLEKHFVTKVTPVFLTRDKSSFEGSVKLKEFVERSSKLARLFVIDLERYFLCYDSLAKKEFRKRSEEIESCAFDQLLHFKNENEFRDALIYQTNINIGHFKLHNCHVRTHYDLHAFFNKKDNVFHYLNKRFTELTKGFKKIQIVSCGLETRALGILGGRLRSDSTSNSNLCAFAAYSGAVVTNEEIGRWLEKSDCIFVLTDIANSCGTINELLRRIDGIVQNRKRMSRPATTEIVVFSVVVMKNTDTTVLGNRPLHHAVKLGRVYYKPNECTLCYLEQPSIEVTNIDDFGQVSQSRLTPLDYWEMVRDCKALIPAKDRGLIHRVNTLLIIRNYRKWLKRLLEHVIEENSIEQPAALITVNEESGQEFAKLVSDVLLDVPICAFSLDRKTRKVVIPNKYDEGIPAKDESVLIVDDGINEGGTIKGLISGAKSLGLRVKGVIVLDNRLPEQQVLRLEQKIQPNGKVLALYSWPVGELTA